ncbi:MAG: reverse gyrase [Ignisphaera sp.]
MPIAIIYRNCCPRCGGDISSVDIAIKGACSACTNNLELTTLHILDKEVENFVGFFVKVTGFSPWSLQRYWIKRLISGESFAMIAPTGVGKSTLLAVYALYKVYYYKSKVYILTPTRELAKQMYSRLSEFIDKAKLKDSIKLLFYDSSSKNVSQTKDAIKSSNFDVLITSAAFLARHHELLTDKRFGLVIADDLDSIMKNSKSVDRILTLLGFDDKDVELAFKIIKLRQHTFLAKASKSQDVFEKIRKELLEFEAVLRNNIAKKNVQLVVASATGRARGLKAQVLKLLLGFDAGAVFEYWRNIVDLYNPLDESLYDKVAHLVKKLGSGIVFVSSLYKEIIEPLVGKLRSEGIKIEVVKSGSKSVDKFRRGEVEVLVGSASYYGILVRGLDEPVRARYTIFVGIPSIVRDLQDSLNNPRFLFMVLRELRRLGYKVDDLINSITRIITNSTPSMLYLYTKLMNQKSRVDPASVNEEIKAKVEILLNIKQNAYKIIRDILNDKRILEVSRNCIITKRGNKYLVIKPDPYTYIQASGRCSRLLRGRKTFGISIIFDEYPQLLSIMETILKRYISTFNIKNLVIDELDLYVKEIENSRSLEGYEVNINISTALIVVESPTKAKTIANMFGRPAKRVLGNTLIYETLIPVTPTRIIVASIMPSLGHITDLVTDEGLYGIKVNGFEYTPIYDFITRCRSCGAQHVGIYDSCPYCGSMDVMCSSSIYNAIKAIAIQVDEAFIATDPDSEGEKIAFDIYNLLLPYNKNIFRIEFREVTRNAILEALRNPRRIDVNKVEAQIARRIADRWIGFELSLWLQMKFGKPWLGAGRVQSPVLLWIANRYKEYKDNFGYVVVVDIGGYKVKWYLGRGFEAREKAHMVTSRALECGLEITRFEFIEKELPPPPPFTTDNLIQEANILFGFTASKTMMIAQTLFELGLITYHRTDTTRLSTTALTIAHEAIKKMNLDKMFVPRLWNREDKAEGAHEAIRPTNSINSEELIEMIIRGDIGILTRISEDHLKLYDLIFRRFIASQMPNTRIRYLRAELRISDLTTVVEVPIEVVLPGFAAVYPVKLYTEIMKNIDLVSNKVRVVKAEVVKGSLIPLYRVADIIKLMRDKGIGRPSTYAKAIDSNIKHGYVIASKKRKALIPTKLGLEVTETIHRYFVKLVGEDVTKQLEALLDEIEEGRISIQDVLNNIRNSIDIAMNAMENGALPPTFNNVNINTNAAIT